MADERATGMPEPLSRLMAELTRLPGIGPRGAERIAFHLLRTPEIEVMRLVDALRDVKENLRPCSQCYNLTDADPCPICGDERRDHGLIVVVEQPKDVMLLEQTGLIRGVYHVLMGHLAPLDGVDPSDLTIDALLRRIRKGQAREVLLATNPTVEGDATALYIHSVLQPLGTSVTRLARGLAVGSEVEYASKAMLEAAITGRVPL